MTLGARFSHQKRVAREKHAWRERRCIESLKYQESAKKQKMLINLEQNSCVNFCSNDYLGLAQSDQIKKAFQRGLDQYTIGTGSSPLVSGYTSAHTQLEQSLAEFLERESVLLFNSGYAANIGTISALMNKADQIILDKLCHASIMDGMKLSGGKALRYPHADIQAVQRRIEQVQVTHELQTNWLITESVFSMDGDLINLKALSDHIKSTTKEINMYVDDAHGLGLLGDEGRGALNYFGLSQEDVPVIVGTFGKAFGGSGAFVAGSKELIEFLINTNRAHIYSTSMPAALAVAMHQSLSQIKEEQWRRDALFSNIAFFKRSAEKLGLNVSEKANGPIQPILLEDNEISLWVSEYLLSKGFYVSAIRPPTVPQGEARLRITLTALHKENEITGLLGAIAEALGAINLKQ